MRVDQSSVDIADLVSKVQRQQIDLQPDFQRGQVWNESKKKRLIDTILRGWYVPAIHIVINEELGTEEILDGQQRVRSIKEFVEGRFVVDGKLEPYDDEIFGLGGLKYHELPRPIRHKFDRYPITTIRLRDYRPSEPGELFFRLNQLTSLTAAEQRNALVGEPRNQVKELVERLSILLPQRIGFSNARMNYDDVISRLAVVFEGGDLRRKVTASILEKRYRRDEPFSGRVYNEMVEAIESLAAVVQETKVKVRFNKASMFSWLAFVASSYVKGSLELLDFFGYFEGDRSGRPIIFDDEFGENLVNEYRIHSKSWIYSLGIFNDRSSSRVNDVNSVILRDLALHIGLLNYRQKLGLKFAGRHPDVLSAMQREMEKAGDDITSRTVLEASLSDEWGAFRALG